MPPRYTYWTIIAGGLPTAFRAAKHEELLPTFNRIREKHPDAQMKWFARGKLWSSPEEAMQTRRPIGPIGPPADGVRRRAPDRRPRAGEHQEGRQERDRDWRPGGEHRDPRQRFKDAKKARNLDHRQARWEHKNRDTRAPRGETRESPPPASKPAREFRPARPHRRPTSGQRPSQGQGRPRRDNKARPPKKDR